MVNPIAQCLILSTSLALCGQQAAAQKSKLDLTRQYLLLATSRTSTLEREIQQAANAGYRVEVGCKPQHYGEWMALMNKVARPPAMYDYKLLATQWTSTMQREIEAAADQGYQVVPRAMMGDDRIVIILEKPSGSDPPPADEKPVAGFHYQLLATTLTGTLQKELSDAAERSFRAVGLFARREHIAILERPRYPAVTSEAPQPVTQYRLLATKRTSTMEMELLDAVSGGYRILASSRTSETEMMTLLEDTGQPCNGCMHKLIAANRLTTMEKELNEAAAKGFRLLWRTAVWKSGAGIAGEASGKVPRVPGAITLKSLEPDQIVGVMEKTPETRGRYRYLVQGAITTSTIRRKINQVTEEGYGVAALLGHPDPEKAFWPVLAHIVVIFEKLDSSDLANRPLNELAGPAPSSEMSRASASAILWE